MYARNFIGCCKNRIKFAGGKKENQNFFTGPILSSISVNTDPKPLKTEKVVVQRDNLHRFF